MKQNPSSLTTFHALHPRYWLTWVLLAFLWWLVRLPYPALLKLGSLLGSLMHRFARKRRHIAQTNIALVFPELNKNEQEQLVRRIFRSVGISFFETPLSWWASDKRLAKLCHIDGLEHLKAALADGKGAILLTAHFTCLELGARLLSPIHPFAVMYKQHSNIPFEILMQLNIKQHFQTAIQRHDVRTMVRTLKKNQACWYAPDQDFGPKQSLFAPFMGITAATLEAPMRLAKMSGAKVVPFFPTRKEDGSGYQITILPALDNFPSGNQPEQLLADATRINAIIEEQVRHFPDQYLWLHRRFKTRPEGEPGLYGWADKKRVRDRNALRSAQNTGTKP